MNISSDAILNSLKEITERNLKEVQQFATLSADKLNAKPSEKAWCILECIEHLNRYSDFYNPEIRKVIDASNHPKSETFKSSWLGNYFAQSMMPKKDKLNKMKTFKSMNPIHASLDHKVLHRFIDHLHQTLRLLDEARQKDLTKIKTGITISKIIKLRLGDTFRVLIHHNDRHVQQALKLLNNAV